MGWKIPPFYGKTPLKVAYKELGGALKQNHSARAEEAMGEIKRLLDLASPK